MTSAAQATLALAPRSRLPLAALAAAAVTIPHALGLGIIAYAPLASSLPVGALALWSAAVPGALATILVNRPGVVYAPTSVVALLFAAIFTLIASSAHELGMSAPQMLAACGLTVAMGFAFQWLLGALRLASFARFLPVSVSHGFAAGVGLSMIVDQLRDGFGMGGLEWNRLLLLQAAAAVAVVVFALLTARRWPRWPGLLAGAVAVAVVLWLTGLAQSLPAVASEKSFLLPPFPDHSGVPWLKLIERHGIQLLSLAVLMAVVNSLDVLVFNQELGLEHGLRAEPNRALRRESLVGVFCGLCGMVPASISASRSRIVLLQAGPSARAGPAHAAILVLVAITGHWWLHWVPAACLSGALLVAGYSQVPAALWSRSYARSAPVSWSQSWLVGLVFLAAGGAGALVAGLAVATFRLLHASASTALRRSYLDGQVRSRRLRPPAEESWLAPRMKRTAVFELQGVMSFGVAAHMTEQVRAMLADRHERVIIDAHRVGAWDATALAQLQALGRELEQRSRQLVVSSLDAHARSEAPPGLLQFPDLDRALEWAEAAMLEEQPAAEHPADGIADALGSLGDGLSAPARAKLEQLLERVQCDEDACLFVAGDTGRELYLVQSGLVTMATAWPPSDGMRLASVGRGVPFGEMAFLSGEPRTACAGAEGPGVNVARLTGNAFDLWAREHPADALHFMRKLALIGTTRLAATTRQLRAMTE